MDQPAKGTIRALFSTCRSYSGVRRCSCRTVGEHEKARTLAATPGNTRRVEAEVEVEAEAIRGKREVEILMTGFAILDREE
jgi:hypothetical protein